jgi:hypothetical protein
MFLPNCRRNAAGKWMVYVNVNPTKLSPRCGSVDNIE